MDSKTKSQNLESKSVSKSKSHVGMSFLFPSSFNCGDANELTDFILNKLSSYIDPLPIDYDNGIIKIENGQIRGLSKIRRLCDCNFAVRDWKTKLFLRLKAHDLSMDFDYQLRFGDLGIEGKSQNITNKFCHFYFFVHEVWKKWG